MESPLGHFQQSLQLDTVKIAVLFLIFLYSVVISEPRQLCSNAADISNLKM